MCWRQRSIFSVLSDVFMSFLSLSYLNYSRDTNFVYEFVFKNIIVLVIYSLCYHILYKKEKERVRQNMLVCVHCCTPNVNAGEPQD